MLSGSILETVLILTQTRFSNYPDLQRPQKAVPAEEFISSKMEPMTPFIRHFVSTALLINASVTNILVHL